MTKGERIVSWIVKLGLWIMVVLVSVGIIWMLDKQYLMVWDAVFVEFILLAFAVAVSFANSYGTPLDHIEKNSITYQAIKLRTVMMHANFCWSILHITLTIAPLYCTCVVIYLSGFEAISKIEIQKAILIYSILSLVLTLATSVIKAKGFSGAYRMASTILYKGIMKRQCAEKDNPEADLELAECINQAEEIIKKFETEEGF